MGLVRYVYARTVVSDVGLVLGKQLGAQLVALDDEYGGPYQTQPAKKIEIWDPDYSSATQCTTGQSSPNITYV